MAVFVGATSVIIRNSTIEARFPGGMESFAASRPNQTFCTDGTITRVGFMDDADAWTYIKQLVAAGLVPSDAEAHMEIALIHQEHGFAYPCDWLQLGLFDGYRSAWLAGTDRGNLFITEIELNSKLEWSSTEDFHRDNELVSVRRDGVEVYRNKKTGEKRYIGRPFRPARKWWQIWKSPGQVLVDSSNHNEVFKAAWNLIKPYITHQLPDAALRGAARQELKRAREMFLGIIAFNPGNWSAHWALGIANKCLRDLPSAYMAFQSAYKLEKEQPDVGRELSSICMALGKGEEAARVSREVMEKHPNNAGLFQITHWLC